jgi:hypothetical protein
VGIVLDDQEHGVSGFDASRSSATCSSCATGEDRPLLVADFDAAPSAALRWAWRTRLHPRTGPASTA